ncbi:MAG TPA: hypothetical protein VFB60_19120 [Ktedonobacteraceae bacterium]|nr:hypothetical protein [Ktedonobacteraceae bacterium]
MDLHFEQLKGNIGLLDWSHDGRYILFRQIFRAAERLYILEKQRPML